VAGGTGNAAVQEAAKNRIGFLLHLDLLSRNPAGDAPESIVDESLQLVQLAQASGTASAIAKMTARFSKGNDALAVLVKNRQDATERVVRDEALLVTAAASQPARRNPANEQLLRNDIARGGQEIAALNEDLAKRFPRFHELVRPEPLPAKAVQALLKPGEAMLVYALGDAGSFLWVIKPETTSFVPLPAKANDIAEKVSKVRADMQADGRGAAQRVRLNLLHELHQSLFAQAAPKLAGVQHILLVPAGALQTLPFGMLVAQSPPGNAATTDYSKVDWLAKQYAFSVLPSVSALHAFRQLSASAPAPNAFAGFGDPLLSEEQGSARGLRQKIAVRGIFRGATRNASGAGGGTGDGGTSEIANADAIRDIARLPETAEELRTMARVLKADPKSIWLQGAATETNVKRLNLSSYRTIAFATHGVMAGELDGIGESGLILTPPAQGSTDDDGYLSASEVAKLKLNADWVILSACNTAAADGTPGAEGLSGLAKAFFYAGARSLLVSHWPVNSAATVPLTTGMLMEYEANPSRGKAQAHRKAILALMVSPKFSHPMYWAPFVVVGEAGAGH
jgi:CHAT domain-containing protein